MDPAKRITVEGIKANPWFAKPFSAPWAGALAEIRRHNEDLLEHVQARRLDMVRPLAEAGCSPEPSAQTLLRQLPQQRLRACSWSPASTLQRHVELRTCQGQSTTGWLHCK